MRTHTDILDQQESLKGPFVGSVLLHAAVAAALMISTLSFNHSGRFGAGPRMRATPWP